MKRIIPALILLAIIIIMCISGDILVDYNCSKTLKILDKCDDAFISGNETEQIIKTEKLISSWNHSRKIISIYSNRESLDEISVCIAIMIRLKKTDNTDYLIESAKVRNYIFDIQKEQSVRPDCFY